MKDIWRRLFARRDAYRRTFLDGEGNPSVFGKVVLTDLARFCKARSSTVYVSPITKQIDPMAMAMAEGRREVWNRLQSFLQISDKELSQLNDTE